MEMGALLKEVLSGNRKIIFLIDCIGAIVTALLAGFVLPYFENEIGMPGHVLIPFSWLAAAYAVYSGSCYIFSRERWRLLLKIIAVANLLYSGLTLMMVFLHGESLSSTGLIYFLAEIVIIAALAYVELRIATEEKP